MTNFETKIAILKQEASVIGATVSDDVVRFIASRNCSEFEMKGVLVRLIAYASLTGRQLTFALAQEVVNHTLEEVDLNRTQVM